MTLDDLGPDNWRHCAALEVEMTLRIYPVVVGQGTRLFPATGPDTALDLVESRSTPSGVTIQVYRPTGRPQYETATPDPRTQRRCRTRRPTGSSPMAKTHPLCKTKTRSTSLAAANKGRPMPQEMIRDAVPGCCDRRQDRLRHPD